MAKDLDQAVAERPVNSHIGDNTIEAMGSGVTIVQGSKENTLEVFFDYAPALVAEIRKVEGVRFDKEKVCWVVPVEKVPELKVAVAAMRKEFDANEAAREGIFDLAKVAAKVAQEKNGTAADIQPRVSDFHKVGEGHSGAIIAENDRYVAQLTGFGKGDGAAFIVVHDKSELGKSVAEGDRVHIKYEGRGEASVLPIVSQAERTAEFDKNLGNNVDGVRVVEQDGKYKIEFDYNPALSSRLQRIDGASFDREAKVWTVGTDKKEFVSRAVTEMRAEVVADRNDRAELEAVANDKISGAKVKDAFTKDGTANTGEILAKNDRYVLQHTGKDYFALHRKAAFEQAPEVGKSLRVEYQKGKAVAGEKAQSKSHGQGIER